MRIDLTESDWEFVLHCLRVAKGTYENDAATMRNYPNSQRHAEAFTDLVTRTVSVEVKIEAQMEERS